MIINLVCSPAIIYLGFSITQIIIDIYKSMYNTAFLKFLVTIVFTIILNILCERGLNIISWLIVFIPFIFMTVITSILLYMFGLDPFIGKLKYNVDDLDKSTSSSSSSPSSPNVNNQELSSELKSDISSNLNFELNMKAKLNLNSELDSELDSDNNDNNNQNLRNNNKLNNISSCLKSCLTNCNKKLDDNKYCEYNCQNICNKIIYNTI